LGKKSKPPGVALLRGKAAIARNPEIICPECVFKALLQVKSPDANSYQ
jgi:DNA-directed RNA polymerase subunit RPC12/RpoP